MVHFISNLLLELFIQNEAGREGRHAGGREGGRRARQADAYQSPRGEVRQRRRHQEVGASISKFLLYLLFLMLI